MKNPEGSVGKMVTVIVITFFFSPIYTIGNSFSFDQFYLYGVPYFGQDATYWCGPACMSMVLSYWGTNLSQGDIAAEIYDAGARITRVTDMVSYPRVYSFTSQDFTGSIYDLKTWINNGVPLIVLQRLSLENPYGHYRVVVGYNDSSAMIFTFDPIKGMNFTISYTEFAQLWQLGSTFSTTNWTLAITPENDVFTDLMKQHQIDMNLQLSNYNELLLEIEEIRKELRRSQDEKTFCLRIFAVTTMILVVVIISFGVYTAFRKPEISGGNQIFQVKCTCKRKA